MRVHPPALCAERTSEDAHKRIAKLPIVILLQRMALCVAIGAVEAWYAEYLARAVAEAGPGTIKEVRAACIRLAEIHSDSRALLAYGTDSAAWVKHMRGQGNAA